VAKIAILAGEPSGDLIASQLMAYIGSKVKNIEFIGVGGPLMKQQGIKVFFRLFKSLFVWCFSSNSKYS
jgi:lipid-A-disaccharide synthase